MLPFRTVLCPTDFSVSSEAAVSAATELARHFHASLRLVHVVPALPSQAPDLNYTFRVPEYEAALRTDAEEKLKQLAARLCGEGLAPEFSVGHGDPGREIARMGAEFDADLIVIGTHGETGWRHALFGSVAERVVRQAACPVLAVRPAKEH
jgi:nucleotide-binding universal stress UspA family protein